MATGPDEALNRPDLQELHSLQDATVWDVDGEKLGKVSQVHLDATGKPVWVTVPLGLLESREKFVSLRGARMGEGALVPDVHVAFSRDLIKGTPDMPTDGNLSEAQVALLNDHYSG
jgi:PRC-barrel domain